MRVARGAGSLRGLTMRIRNRDMADLSATPHLVLGMRNYFANEVTRRLRPAMCLVWWTSRTSWSTSDGANPVLVSGGSGRFAGGLPVSSLAPSWAKIRVHPAAQTHFR